MAKIKSPSVIFID